MEEVQEQRYICKICSKSCVSGKSLGGHMRIHLALISASKKAASAKAESSKMKSKGGGDDQNQSNSTVSTEERIKNSDDFGDDDQSNIYELRENPKKSLKISDSKHCFTENGVSCKECGKDFPTLRALSGHMRCHSIKNKEMHCCKKCGKGFDSMRAMFGHMKSHSKKSRTLDESADSLSELENLCPIRRKRSKIMYKNTPNPSFCSMNSAEIGEVEAAASCLIMLSMGVTDWNTFKPVTEFSDDDSAYFDAKGKKIAENDGDFLPDVKKMSLPIGKFDSCGSGSVKMDLDSMCLAENETRVDFKVLDYGLGSVGNDDGMHLIDFLKKPEKLKGCVAGNSASYEFSKSNSWKEVSVSVHESGSDFDDHETLKEFMEKSKEKIFHSQYYLESYNAGYKIQENGSSMNMTTSHNEIKQENGDVASENLNSSKNKERECPVCFKVFRSGQALGGHKKAHYNGNGIKTEEAIVVNQEIAGKIHGFFDLNVPVNHVDEGTNLWWLQKGHEHEALVLTN